MKNELQENVDVTLRVFESLAEIWKLDKVEALVALRDKTTQRLRGVAKEKAAGNVVALRERRK